MKIVPQSDPSDGIHKLHDTKQMIAAKEEKGENTPSTTSSPKPAFVSKGKGVDNKGADKEGDEAVIVERAAVGDGVMYQ